MAWDSNQVKFNISDLFFSTKSLTLILNYLNSNSINDNVLFLKSQFYLFFKFVDIIKKIMRQKCPILQIYL